MNQKRNKDILLAAGYNGCYPIRVLPSTFPYTKPVSICQPLLEKKVQVPADPEDTEEDEDDIEEVPRTAVASKSTGPTNQDSESEDSSSEDEEERPGRFTQKKTVARRKNQGGNKKKAKATPGTKTTGMVITSDESPGQGDSPVSDGLRNTLTARNSMLANQSVLQKKTALVVAKNAAEHLEQQLQISKDKLTTVQGMYQTKCDEVKQAKKDADKYEEMYNSMKKRVQDLMMKELKNDKTDHDGKKKEFTIEELNSNKEAVKTVFRKFKFISTQKQMKNFGEMVMNVIDDSDLVVGAPVSDDEDNPLSDNNVARRNRVAYAARFKDIWRKILNEHRSYTQVNDLVHIILTKRPIFSPLSLNILTFVSEY